MILGELARSLNGGFIAVSTLLFCVSVLSVAYLPVAPSLRRSSARCREHVLWALLLFPWLAAMLVSYLVLSPSLAPYKPDWMSALTHWHHAELFDTRSWHVLPLAVFAVVLVLALIRTGLALIRHRRSMRWFLQCLEVNALRAELDSQWPSAFTYGFLRPRIFVSAALKKALSPEEYSAVLHHEQAHLKRYDPLKKFCFACLSHFFPSTVAQRLRAEYALSLEQSADMKAVASGNENALIAKTLLKVYRLNRSTLPSYCCAFAETSLEARVRYLMAPRPDPTVHYVAAALLFAGMLALSLFGVDSYHHSFERFFDH
ncbi:BlaR1 peptidase M56 [Spongiibacter sp. IMCC21906]|jgi:Zn-dependent protease with chaperone function|uniref:M56 family metallopeptidase n=1 Tax=Spongiibacter sp. IMCC21906 TaxID=1620392 RepID=UPI00062DF361|nr:M56 family metallopeptidase [Spongiibacter sp. IMCC21906]AKH68779.1 BlaR1 peptidase M56 [Spongiibacter sp. IMCC21906]